MASSVQALLGQNLPPAIFISVEGISPSLSRKEWARDFRGIGAGCHSDEQTIEERLSSLYDGQHDFTETIRLQRPVNNLSEPYELIEHEADNHFIAIRERSQAGPPRRTSESKTINHYFSWAIGDTERCLCAGEEMRDISKRLGKEIRGYAFKYDCPQERDKIKSADYEVDTWLIPRSRRDGDQSTMRWAFYNMVWRGWMRLVGQLSAAIPVQLGSYRREFEYWSGRPVWRNVHDRRDKRYSHPDGYQRIYDAAQRMYY
ncbi:hypothetical protein SODALDRAFT_346870 [Sodiomyces alkalinus F11]|uniref:Uncharacterized protein n=1 Tax=Sodiomyces alkalinus (strain CBS 110278 / VKM F-3762 / F11) TaxID=1314773 RepID=A0A3N2PJC0_SODAK|nr:hypothetical protein SODALDRAFT_346870 [Sodiomyces alkalinus F11]ROT34609.1 hypothetical protein SODALDRAFT_346870 [Sodiomyces alkalinus F11]